VSPAPGTGADGAPRCHWAVGDPLYQAYHDHEWGRPSTDDRALFEKLVLEGFQAGLAWITVLRKRDRLREVFFGFDPARMAAMTDDDVERLAADPGIIRHRGKIRSAVANAARLPDLQEEHGSLAEFVWGFAPPPGPPPDAIPAATPESAALARALKQRGWTFVGPTTVYAFMQAMGLVNDHAAGCVTRDAAEAERRLVFASR
jgi:DNA-3-methyladenine glycosylase I